jgi:hypothetical protein
MNIKFEYKKYIYSNTSYPMDAQNLAFGGILLDMYNNITVNATALKHRLDEATAKEDDLSMKAMIFQQKEKAMDRIIKDHVARERRLSDDIDTERKRTKRLERDLRHQTDDTEEYRKKYNHLKDKHEEALNVIRRAVSKSKHHIEFCKHHEICAWCGESYTPNDSTFMHRDCAEEVRAESTCDDCTHRNCIIGFKKCSDICHNCSYIPY